MRKFSFAPRGRNIVKFLCSPTALRRGLNSFAASWLTSSRTCFSFFPGVSVTKAGCRLLKERPVPAGVLSGACSVWWGPAPGLGRRDRLCRGRSTRARPCCGCGRWRKQRQVIRSLMMLSIKSRLPRACHYRSWLFSVWSAFCLLIYSSDLFSLRISSVVDEARHVLKRTLRRTSGEEGIQDRKKKHTVPLYNAY